MISIFNHRSNNKKNQYCPVKDLHVGFQMVLSHGSELLERRAGLLVIH